MNKVLVLGAAGMAGHVIYTVLKESGKFEVYGTVNRKSFADANLSLNIYNTDDIKRIVNEVKPDVVVNCIGVLINGSKESAANTIYINSYFPHLLKRLCEEYNAKLIHISTDCVFSGDKGGYTEESPKDAKDLYGQSKALGEVVSDSHLTIRTSIIGPELTSPGEGLFDWFMRQQGEINGYKSAYWSGVTTLELAHFIAYESGVSLNGLVHLTNNEPISKFDLLNIINTHYNKNLKITSDKDYKIDKSFRNTNKQLEYTVPTYEEMISQQKHFMLAHKDLYETYGAF